MKMNRVVIYLCLMPLFIACQAVTLQPERPTIVLPAGTGATVTSTTASSIQTPTGSPVDFVWRIKGDPNRLGRPMGMAFDAQDNLYVIDGNNHRIQKFDRDGKFLLTWGSYGSEEGQFVFRNGEDHPGAIAINPQGEVYVADYSGFVQVFDGQGKFLRKWGGGFGTGDGQFITPRCMAFDKQGDIYLSDAGPNDPDSIMRIEKFDAEGNFLRNLSVQSYCMALDGQSNVYVANAFKHRIEKYDSQGTLLTTWGSQGKGDGQFAEPEGIAADAEGNVYVADNASNFRIEKFDSNGNFLGKWGSWGSEDGQFDYPRTVATDSQGNVYVADDGGNDSIQKFHPREPEQPTIVELPTATVSENTVAAPDTALAASTGSPVDFVWRVKGDPNRLARPTAMAFDAQDNLYVIDSNHDRIQKFDRDGKFLLTWGSYGSKEGQFVFRNGADHPGAIAINAQGLVYVADYSGFVQVFDGQGKFLRKWGGGAGLDDGQFSTPRCMAFDKQGDIYISDGGDDHSEGIFRIQKFDADGNFLLKWSIQSFCMALDDQSNVYIGNPFKYRIEKYDSQGTLLRIWGSQGKGDGQFDYPEGIAVDVQGNAYVADNPNSRIEKFDANGNFLGKWGSWGSEDGQFNNPWRITIDSQGNVYVADDGDNDSIQKFHPR